KASMLLGSGGLARLPACPMASAGPYRGDPAPLAELANLRPPT
ncbi:hypothetical protein AVEN_5510-1, partial [Araneus ventricosus]